MATDMHLFSIAEKIAKKIFGVDKIHVVSGGLYTHKNEPYTSISYKIENRQGVVHFDDVEFKTKTNRVQQLANSLGIESEFVELRIWMLKDHPAYFLLTLTREGKLE